MRNIINGFFRNLNKEAYRFNKDCENYQLSHRSFYSIFWRLTAIANPVGCRADFDCCDWLRKVYESYVDDDFKSYDLFIDTVIMKRALEMNNINFRPYSIEGWFVKR